MNINRTEALSAINNHLNPKQDKSANTVFADLLSAQQQAQSSATPPAAAPATPSTSMPSLPAGISPTSPTTVHTAAQATSATTSTTTEKSSAAQEFLDYMAMSDAEKMRVAVLKEMGLTEEEFEQLPPEEQLAIEQKIVERLKQETGVSDTGFNTEAVSLLL